MKKQSVSPFKNIFKKRSKKAPKKRGKPSALLSFTTARFSLKEQMLLAKRLSFLINANVPLLDGLHILREQTPPGGRARMLDLILIDISEGQSLARSFGKFPKVFGEFAIQIIKIGESSGTLSQNLTYLADELKKRQALRRKVIGAFIYPAVISVATVGITIFLMVYLFPKIMPIFASLHSTLPLSTRIVMTMSNFLRAWGIELLAALALALAALVIVLKRSKKLTFAFQGLLLHVPLLGPIMRYYNIANGSRTLGLLLRSGVKLSDALPITADTMQNLVYRAQFVQLAESVSRGEKISSHMAKHRILFPDMFQHMVAVGERSGTLSDTLVCLSEMYEAEVDDFTKNLSTLIEPFMMVIMGLIVGFIAVSIITPIYGITQNLHG